MITTEKVKLMASFNFQEFPHLISNFFSPLPLFKVRNRMWRKTEEELNCPDPAGCFSLGQEELNWVVAFLLFGTHYGKDLNGIFAQRAKVYVSNLRLRYYYCYQSGLFGEQFVAFVEDFSSENFYEKIGATSFNFLLRVDWKMFFMLKLNGC